MFGVLIRDQRFFDTTMDGDWLPANKEETLHPGYVIVFIDAENYVSCNYIFSQTSHR